MPLREEKAALRRRLRLQRSGLIDKDRCDRRIIQRLLMMPEIKKAQSIFIFVGTDEEIDTLPLINALLMQGKQVAVPLVLKEPGRMAAKQIRYTHELRHKGAFGILEPEPSASTMAKKEIDFAVVPCLTCDRQGNRLGQGGGYYDRYLEGRTYKAAAICYEALLQDHLPTETWDRPVDMVVTEERIYRCN